MKRYLWACVLWPVVLLLVPNVYDDTVRSDERVIHDTTYADGRYVALVPGYEDTIWHDLEGWVRFIPDQDSIGPNVAYRAIRAPSGDSFLVISYDYLVADALDSATVDSIWDDWGLGAPYAYVVNVPGIAQTIDTAGAWVFMDFSEYTSTADFLSDPSNKWGADFSRNFTQLFLDSSFAYPGLQNSMRADFIYEDSAAFCASQSVGRGLSIPDYDSLASRPVREYWFESAIYMPGTAVGCPPLPERMDCRDAPFNFPSHICAWKMAMVAVNRSEGYGRWMTTAWNQGSVTPDVGAGWRFEAPRVDSNGVGKGWDGWKPSGDSTDFQSPAQGKWVKLRQHIKMSSDPDSLNGYVLNWIDDRLIGPAYENGMDGGFTGREDPDTLHASPRWDDPVRGVGPFEYYIGRNKDRGGYYAPDPLSQWTAQNPWIEHFWVGYMTVWTNPDTPSWYPNIEKPAYVPATGQ